MIQFKYTILFFIFFPYIALSQKPKKVFFPMKVGNYWVYSSSNPLFKNDTVRITGSKNVELGIGYYVNTELWVEKNDSVYIFQHSRGGAEFPALHYFPYEKELVYDIIIGDLLVRRTVSKIQGAYKVNGKRYNNCYKYSVPSSSGGEVIIIAKGVGIIEITTPENKKSLLKYKLQ